ncbi:Protein OS-9 [Hypsizygus marmoreus]|uniref:Protein OS-9 homolog n=1 Tax=Hypsizygus marmoreus TaxID=39966 RepID=A0A369JJC4_HYPMA|nr:Protein OS-9 [Hypsizygus marmoreus]
MRLPSSSQLLTLPAAVVAARLLHSIPEDTYAFPKFRVSFLNRLPLLDETADRWLKGGLRGGELEFLDQPWTEQPSSALKEIDSGPGVSQVPLTTPGAANYTLEKMKMGKDAYLCLVPKPVEHTPPPPEETESDFDLTPSRSWSLLQPLSGTCLYHRQGWFTYSYCHNEEIRQFKEAQTPNSAGGHRPPEEDPEWEAYTLGRAPKPGADLTVAEQNAQAVNLELARNAGSRYLVQRWGEGTICDKTGKPREVEVQFHCSMTMTDTILFVKEAKTCSYVLVIHTPRLCGEPGFKSRHDKGEENLIRCREIVDTKPPAGGAGPHSNLPDLDHPLKAPRRKPVLPAPVKDAKGVETKDTVHNDLLRKTIEAILSGKDVKHSKVVLGEVAGDKDGVVFEIVEEEADMTEGQVDAMDQLTDALRAAGYNVRAEKVSLGKKQSEKGQEQAKKKKT